MGNTDVKMGVATDTVTTVERMVKMLQWRIYDL